MKTVNRIAAQVVFALLFMTGLGWFLGHIGFWERNTRFQQWLNRHDGLTPP